MLKKIKLWIASFFTKKEKITEVKRDPQEKKSNATRHAKQRLAERYGEVLTEEMADLFVEDIKSGKAKFLKNTRNNTQTWVVTYNNKKYRVIYNKKLEIIVTICRNLKSKFIKPSRRKRKKRLKRLHVYDASFKKRKTKFKKPYKRNKRVDYSESLGE